VKVNVYVPADDVEPNHAMTVIKPGSGIVGEPSTQHEGLMRVYFEGNLYGAPGLGSYHAKVRQAAGRMVERYPTIAQMHVDRDKLVYVGQYDTEADELLIEDELAVGRWLLREESDG